MSKCLTQESRTVDLLKTSSPCHLGLCLHPGHLELLSVEFRHENVYPSPLPSFSLLPFLHVFIDIILLSIPWSHVYIFIENSLYGFITFLNFQPRHHFLSLLFRINLSENSHHLLYLFIHMDSGKVLQKITQPYILVL